MEEVVYTLTLESHRKDKSLPLPIGRMTISAPTPELALEAMFEYCTGKSLASIVKEGIVIGAKHEVP
jgi:hypothetical protein